MKIIKATREDFDLIYSEMEKSFIREEIRDYDSALETLNEESYSIYHALDGDIRVGFMTVWELSGFAFLEHFVTYESFRNKGYGQKALTLLKEKFGRIILEAEPPLEDIQKRRISFYQRNGFRKNDFPYIQPPYRASDTGVGLILMSYPEPLGDAAPFVKEIYEKVYKKSTI